MPDFTFTSPEGKSYTVTGPEGSTQEQAWGILQSQLGASAPAAAPAEPRSAGREVARQLGLTVRHAITGLTSLPAVAGNALNSGINYGIDKINEAAGTSIGKLAMPSEIIQRAESAAGLPEPETATERVVGDAASAMTGVGATAKVGQALANTGSKVAQGVGAQLQQGLGLQTTSAATGATAAGVTRENGGGAVAQIAAGIAGGLAPSVGPAGVAEAVRRGIRGGEAGRQNMLQRMGDFQAQEVQPSLAQAAGTRRMQTVESAASKFPGGAGRMAEFASQQTEQMRSAVQRIADDLAPTGADPTLAGEAVQRGVQRFKETFKAAQRPVYAELDELLPKEMPTPFEKAKAALADMNEGINGAENLSRFFKNSKLLDIEKALLADAKDSVRQPGANSAMPLAPLKPTLPYESLRKLRTAVGNEIADAGLTSDIPRSKFRTLYAALSDDLAEAAKAAGPKAETAWQRANQFTRDHLQRLEELEGIMRKDTPELVFKAATNGVGDGATTIRRVMSALSPEDRNIVSASVLQRLGHATAGQQNAAGNLFSSETFLTSLNKLSPAARTALFGSKDDLIAQIARLAETRREGAKVFSNPSGTAQTSALMSVVGGLAGGGAAMAVGPASLPAAVTAVGSANLAARAATSRGALKFATKKTTLGDGGQAAAVAAPIRLTSPTDLPPEQREVGREYMLPQGRFVWRGNGWVPAP